MNSLHDHHMFLNKPHCDTYLVTIFLFIKAMLSFDPLFIWLEQIMIIVEEWKRSFGCASLVSFHFDQILIVKHQLPLNQSKNEHFEILYFTRHPFKMCHC